MQFIQFLYFSPLRLNRYGLKNAENTKMQEILKMQDILLVELSLLLSIERIAGTRVTDYTVVSLVEHQIRLVVGQQPVHYAAVTSRFISKCCW